jgi:hypothetical protein
MWEMWSTPVEEIHMIRLIYKGSVFFISENTNLLIVSYWPLCFI